MNFSCQRAGTHGLLMFCCLSSSQCCPQYCSDSVPRLLASESLAPAPNLALTRLFQLLSVPCLQRMSSLESACPQLPSMIPHHLATGLLTSYPQAAMPHSLTPSLLSRLISCLSFQAPALWPHHIHLLLSKSLHFLFLDASPISICQFPVCLSQ